MRLGPDALLEIVDIVRNGIVNGMDISQQLRELDLEQSFEEDGEQLSLSRQYLQNKKEKIA